MRVFDGISWAENEVSAGSGGFLSLSVRGLPADADLISARLYAGVQRLPLTYLGEELSNGARQMNAQLEPVFRPGRVNIELRHGAGVCNSGAGGSPSIR